MQARKKSFAAGMQQTQGLARTASQVFFKQEKTETPIIKRNIFWINLLVFLGYLAGALAIVIMFFKTSPPEGAYATAFSSETAPPTSWGTDGLGNPCPFGGCTNAPTPFPPATKAPTSQSPSTSPSTSPV